MTLIHLFKKVDMLCFLIGRVCLENQNIEEMKESIIEFQKSQLVGQETLTIWRTQVDDSPHPHNCSSDIYLQSF